MGREGQFCPSPEMLMHQKENRALFFKNILYLTVVTKKQYYNCMWMVVPYAEIMKVLAMMEQELLIYIVVLSIVKEMLQEIVFKEVINQFTRNVYLYCCTQIN